MSGDLRSDLIAAAKHFYDRGWMVGTAGNLSARLAYQMAVFGLLLAAARKGS